MLSELKASSSFLREKGIVAEMYVGREREGTLSPIYFNTLFGGKFTPVLFLAVL